MNLMAAPNCIKNFFNFLIDSFKRDIDRGKGYAMPHLLHKVVIISWKEGRDMPGGQLSEEA